MPSAALIGGITPTVVASGGILADTVLKSRHGLHEVVGLVLGGQEAHPQQEVVVALDNLLVDGEILLLTLAVGHISLVYGLDGEVEHLAQLRPSRYLVILCLPLEGIDVVLEGKELALNLAALRDPCQVNLTVGHVGCLNLGTALQVGLYAVSILHLRNGRGIGCDAQGVLDGCGSLRPVLVLAVGDRILHLGSQSAGTQFHDLYLSLLGVVMIEGHGLGFRLSDKSKSQYEHT